MTETEVFLGSGRAERVLRVGNSLGFPWASGREGIVIVEAVGLMGIAGMLWWWYQANTVRGDL